MVFRRLNFPDSDALPTMNGDFPIMDEVCGFIDGLSERGLHTLRRVAAALDVPAPPEPAQVPDQDALPRGNEPKHHSPAFGVGDPTNAGRA